MGIFIQTITVILIVPFVLTAIHNTKNEDTDNPIIKFTKSLINILAICTGFWIVILIVLLGISISRYGETNTSLLFASLIFFGFFLFTASLYLYVKKKIIKIEDDKIHYSSLFKKHSILTFEDIEYALDIPGNKIKIIMKTKKHISVDYQMDNIEIFRNILIEKKVILHTKDGKELW